MIRKALVVAACFCTWACTRDPEPFSSSRTKSATAVVQAVSRSDRHLVINTTDGRRLLVEMPSDVTRFDQIRQGDKVILTYYEGLVAEVARAGQAPKSAHKATTQSHTPPGEASAKGRGKTIVTTVRIEAVDPSSGTVTFTRPDGITRTLPVENPDARRFAESLTPGTQVQITYREATAVSVWPARE